MWHVRLTCEPYIRKLRQCLNCLRFGHITTNCSGKEKCRKCGIENHLQNNCNADKPKCVNCRDEHFATDKECPERIRQINVNITMALKNLSYHEAMLEHPKTYLNANLYSVITSNKFAALSNEKEFPYLNKSHDKNIPNDVPVFTADARAFKKYNNRAFALKKNQKRRFEEDRNNIRSLEDIENSKKFEDQSEITFSKKPFDINRQPMNNLTPKAINDCNKNENEICENTKKKQKTIIENETESIIISTSRNKDALQLERDKYLSVII